MILEVAVLDVIPGREVEFEQAFDKAEDIVASIPGYVSHQLHRCLEQENRYLLLINWMDLESHTRNFRQCPKYERWKSLLHHFYDPFPAVEHYQLTRRKGDQSTAP